MLLYQLSRLWLEFLAGLDSKILGVLAIFLLVTWLIVDSDLGKAIAFLVVGVPIIFYLFGMFADFLLGQGAWKVAGIILYLLMDAGIIVGAVMLVMWLLKEIRH